MQSIHGGDIYQYPDIIDFSANINPLGTPASVLQAITDSLQDVKNYPDIYCQKLRAQIAKFHDVDVEHVICGNGAADLIFRLVFALQPKKALVLAPCFAEYEQALKAVGAKVRHYKLNRKTFRLGADYQKALTDDLDMICLCNPNNPTGKTIDKELLQEVVRICRQKKIWLLLDECFLDFLEDEQDRTYLNDADKESYLFVLRAFTKMYAVPGVRLGYGICSDTGLLERMYQTGPPWNVSTLAQAAGIAALQEEEFVTKTRTYIKYEKLYLYRELTRLGIPFWEGAANYIFFRFKEGLKEKMIPHGILVRDCGNYRNLDATYYRIAVKTRECNEKLIEALEHISHIEAEAFSKEHTS